MAAWAASVGKYGRALESHNNIASEGVKEPSIYDQLLVVSHPSLAAVLGWQIV